MKIRYLIAAIPLLISSAIAQIGQSKIGSASVGSAFALPAGPTINNAWKNFTASSPGTCTVAPTAGHALVVAVMGSDTQTPGSLPSVSDNIDGTTGWNKATGRTNSLSGYSMVTYLFYKFNIASGVTTITASGSAINNIEIIVHDVSNISAFTSTEISNASGTSTTNPQVGAVNNGTANSIYFAAVDNDDSDSFTINQTGTTGTWNHFSANSHEDNGTFTVSSVPNLVVTSSASRGHGWGMAAPHNTAQCLAIFH